MFFKKARRASNGVHDQSKVELIRLSHIANNPDAPNGEREEAQQRIRDLQAYIAMKNGVGKAEEPANQ